MWSKSKKAKPCRNAARFLTLFYFSPIGPSGAKINSMGVENGSPQGEPMRYAQPYGSFTVGIVGRGLDPSGQISDNTRFSGRIWNPPLRQPKILAPEGSIGESRKSVKKSAALLRFLAFLALDHPFGVPRGERLAAHNERRQFTAQTRSCGYSPRWGEHCSLPSFAALNRGPLLATPQSPGPGSAASEQRDFFRFLFCD